MLYHTNIMNITFRSYNIQNSGLWIGLFLGSLSKKFLRFKMKTKRHNHDKKILRKTHALPKYLLVQYCQTNVGFFSTPDYLQLQFVSISKPNVYFFVFWKLNIKNMWKIGSKEFVVFFFPQAIYIDVKNLFTFISFFKKTFFWLERKNRGFMYIYRVQYCIQKFLIYFKKSKEKLKVWIIINNPGPAQ